MAGQPFELDNDDRRYLGLAPVGDHWEPLELAT